MPRPVAAESRQHMAHFRESAQGATALIAGPLVQRPSESVGKLKVGSHRTAEPPCCTCSVRACSSSTRLPK
jgi:hypothetical protein